MNRWIALRCHELEIMVIAIFSTSKDAIVTFGFRDLSFCDTVWSQRAGSVF